MLQLILKLKKSNHEWLLRNCFNIVCTLLTNIVICFLARANKLFLFISSMYLFFALKIFFTFSFNLLRTYSSEEFRISLSSLVGQSDENFSLRIKHSALYEPKSLSLKKSRKNRPNSNRCS